MTDQPLEVLAEETGDERQRQENRGEDRELLDGGVLPDTDLRLSTEITAKLASSTVLSRSRCAATSSEARTRSSSTSTRYGRSSGGAMVRLTVVRYLHPGRGLPAASR